MMFDVIQYFTNYRSRDFQQCPILTMTLYIILILAATTNSTYCDIKLALVYIFDKCCQHLLSPTASKRLYKKKDFHS